MDTKLVLKFSALYGLPTHVLDAELFMVLMWRVLFFHCQHPLKPQSKVVCIIDHMLVLLTYLSIREASFPSEGGTGGHGPLWDLHRTEAGEPILQGKEELQPRS